MTAATPSTKLVLLGRGHFYPHARSPSCHEWRLAGRKLPKNRPCMRIVFGPRQNRTFRSSATCANVAARGGCSRGSRFNPYTRPILRQFSAREPPLGSDSGRTGHTGVPPARAHVQPSPPACSRSALRSSACVPFMLPRRVRYSHFDVGIFLTGACHYRDGNDGENRRDEWRLP